MVPPRKDDDLGRSEGYDQFPDEGASEGFCESDDSGSGSAPPPRISAAREDVFRRLRDVLSGESDEREAAVLPWLQALDLQVLGACRADERSKPLLKLNVSGSPAEERLLAQLSQHFEASEIGMLARCLCVPLVSVRVGKVKKQGSILCPTAKSFPAAILHENAGKLGVCDVLLRSVIYEQKKAPFLSLYRGQLNLNLLPSSNMRLSFIGDDGCTERLAVLSNDFDSPDVVIEEISADTSGRSFLLKLPGPQILYYWCSEKSKIHGLELLDKMKDLLRKKPSLSCLTGISESRLDSFATHLRAYLLGGSSSAEVSPAASCPTETECQSSRSFRSRTMSAHAGKVHSLCQGSLSPRLNSFKDEMPRMLSSIRTREKIKYHGDAHLSMSTRSSELITSISPSSSNVAYSSKRENDNPSNTGGSSALPSCLPDIPSLPSPFSTLSPVSIHLPLTQISSSSSFSPYYCWCPPCPSSLQYTVNPFHLSSTPSELIPLPPLSSLLPVASSTVASVPSRLPIDVAECRALSLPSLIPDPLIPSSISVTLSLPCSQQLPIFTPFMTDPIVHIPMFNFCSSGQGYLVSAGPAISSVISPLLPSLVTPLIPKTESLIEKNARETLQMLMASAPSVTGPQLMNVLPAVLNKLGENFSCTNMVNNSSALAGNSQLFCDGSTDTVSTGSSCLNLHSEEGTPRADDSLRFTMADHLDNDDNIDEPLWDGDLL